MNHFAGMEIRRILGTSNYLYNHVLRKGRNNNMVYLTAVVKLFIYTRLNIKEAYNEKKIFYRYEHFLKDWLRFIKKYVIQFL